MPEAEILSALVGLIYEAALDAALWPKVLDEIRLFVGSTAASFSMQGLPPFGAKPEKPAICAWLLAIIRNGADGTVDHEGRRRARLVEPHVQRAASICQLIDRKEATSAGLAQALSNLAAGTFLLDGAGEMLFANAPGQRLLEERKILFSSGNVLVAADAAANRELQDAVRSAKEHNADANVRGSTLLLHSGQEQWLAQVLPLDPRRRPGEIFACTVVVFVRKAGASLPSSVDFIARRFKLTAREARVLNGVIHVGSVPDIAEALGISSGTVRTHLKSIFAKTGVARQVDLVKLALGYASPSDG